MTDRIGKAKRQFELAALRARKMIVVGAHRDYWHGLKYGVLPAVEHHRVHFGHEFRTVVDVGASRGQFALFALKKWPAAEVICFEPIPDAAESLHRALGGRVVIHRTALGSEDSTHTLNLSAKDDSSSLLKFAAQAAQYPGTGSVGVVDVPVRTLASHLGPDLQDPILLKIDVQGYELEVLRGSLPQLERVDEVLCECSFLELYEGQPMASEVISFLAAAGFTLVGVYGMSQSMEGGQMQADFLFRRSPDSKSRSSGRPARGPRTTTTS